MKKIFIYFFAFLFICFIFPALLTKREKETSSEVNNIEINDTSKVEENVQSQYEYKKYGTIKLLHQKTGEVEEVNLDTYLCNVVSAEMPADYEKEALKAQAVVARTYTIYKIENKKHDNADICDSSTCCQAWVSKETRLERWEESKREENWNKIEQCVNETKGKIVTYDGKPINAFFHANSGGTTELPVNVWGGSGLPYLQVVQTAGEEGYTQYNSEVILGEDELINKLKTKYEDIQINFADEQDIKILEYTDSNRVKTVKFGNHEISGVETRTLLGLKSTNFQITREDGKVKFTVKGYGHGVGMSQTGADTMAKQGSLMCLAIQNNYLDRYIECCVNYGIPYAIKSKGSYQYCLKLPTLRFMRKLYKALFTEDGYKQYIIDNATCSRHQSRADRNFKEKIRAEKVLEWATLPPEQRTAPLIEYIKTKTHKPEEQAFLIRAILSGNIDIADDFVLITNIHQVKGAESDYVLLCDNVAGIYRNQADNDVSYRDYLLRVFYVGVTRAKKGVYIWHRDTYSTVAPTAVFTNIGALQTQELVKSACAENYINTHYTKEQNNDNN